MHEASYTEKNEECIACRSRWRIRVEVKVGLAARSQYVHSAGLVWSLGVRSTWALYTTGTVMHIFRIGKCLRIRSFCEREPSETAMTRVSICIFGRQGGSVTLEGGTSAEIREGRGYASIR